MRKKLRPCYVYCIGHELKCGSLDGPVKFGITEDPGKRLAQLQTGSPRKLAVLAVIMMPERKFASHLEKYIHGHFEENRLSGEWFGVSAFEAGGALAALTYEVLTKLGGAGESLNQVLSWTGATDLMIRWGEENARRERDGGAVQ